MYVNTIFVLGLCPLPCSGILCHTTDWAATRDHWTFWGTFHTEIWQCHHKCWKCIQPKNRWCLALFVITQGFFLFNYQLSNVVSLAFLTGIFTAPVKGVYFFTFVVFNRQKCHSGVKLMRNGEMVVSATENKPNKDKQDTTSNSSTLLLEQSDQVYIEMFAKRTVYTDEKRRNTFSGHLLYPMWTTAEKLNYVQFSLSSLYWMCWACWSKIKRPSTISVVISSLSRIGQWMMADRVSNIYQ